MSLLQKESELNEIVRLVGTDALSETEKLVMEIAKSIREDFLHQNAFDDVDTFTSGMKQYYMIQNIIKMYEESFSQLKLHKTLKVTDIMKLPVRASIARVKYIPEEELQKCDLTSQIKSAIEQLSSTLEESND